MDDFNKQSMEFIGPGGIGCPCCDAYFKIRKKMRRRQRAMLKKETRKEIDEQTNDQD